MQVCLHLDYALTELPQIASLQYFTLQVDLFLRRKLWDEEELLLLIVKVEGEPFDAAVWVIVLLAEQDFVEVLAFLGHEDGEPHVLSRLINRLAEQAALGPLATLLTHTAGQLSAMRLTLIGPHGVVRPGPFRFRLGQRQRCRDQVEKRGDWHRRKRLGVA